MLWLNQSEKLQAEIQLARERVGTAVDSGASEVTTSQMLDTLEALKDLASQLTVLEHKAYLEVYRAQFWALVKLEKAPEACWTWLGPSVHKKKDRGPRAEYRRKMPEGWSYETVAARICWKLVFGDISEGLWVCHRCDNPMCVRPTHLFLGTNQDNMVDCVLKGRHPLQKLNAYQAAEIRRRLDLGEKQVDLAREFGVNAATVADIKHRRNWKHLEEEDAEAA